MPRTLRAAPAAACAARLSLAATLAALCLLGACTSHRGSSAYQHASRYAASSRYYPPPGPSSDPWKPYIQEASARYKVPERWIREVMRQESGGQEQVTSSAGAMGLMQVMPDTYDGLRRRYGLGSDPFEPHDNIMAGTAYIREMYDRFGAPGFLAAYNAGPNRLDSYLGGGGPLPDETVNYVASIAPRIAGTTRLTGPLAAYAQVGNAPPDIAPQVVQVAAPVAMASGWRGACDPDAAYDPGRRCTPIPAPSAAPVVMASSAGCDPDVAFDPGRACTPPSSLPPPRPFYQPPAPVITASIPAATTMRAVPSPASGSGEWAIQVGAFSSPMLARAAATGVHDALADLLSTAQVELLPTTPFGGRVLFRARLSNISANAASTACARLATEQQPCMVVAPGQTL
jgi:D-alanyl-D-alanine carboxypeptidase